MKIGSAVNHDSHAASRTVNFNHDESNCEIVNVISINASGHTWFFFFLHETQRGIMCVSLWQLLGNKNSGAKRKRQREESNNKIKFKLKKRISCKT